MTDTTSVSRLRKKLKTGKKNLNEIGFHLMWILLLKLRSQSEHISYLSVKATRARLKHRSREQVKSRLNLLSYDLTHFNSIHMAKKQHENAPLVTPIHRQKSRLNFCAIQIQQSDFSVFP
jgi:hypothetical protein